MRVHPVCSPREHLHSVLGQDCDAQGTLNAIKVQGNVPNLGRGPPPNPNPKSKRRLQAEPCGSPAPAPVSALDRIAHLARTVGLAALGQGRSRSDLPSRTFRRTPEPWPELESGGIGAPWAPRAAQH